MTGAVLAVIIAVLGALGVLAVILSERSPDGGWAQWLRDSVAAWRSEELTAEQVRTRRADVSEAGLEDIFDMGPTAQPAYIGPGDIASRIERARSRARGRADR